MKTKLLALTALSMLTLSVATGCSRTPSTSDSSDNTSTAEATEVTIAAATEWDVDNACAVLEGSLVKVSDESIVSGKHGNTIFMQQVVGDYVSDIKPVEVVLDSSEDADSISVRDWVTVEGTVKTVNGRVIIDDAKLLTKETKSREESPLYGYTADRGFISEVGRSYSGFLGFDVTLELVSDPDELVAGTDTVLECVYPGEPTDEDSLLAYGIEVVVPGDLDTASLTYFNKVLNGGTVTYSDGSTEELAPLAVGDQISFGVLHLWFDNYLKFVVTDIDARNAEQHIIEEFDTDLSALLIDNFTEHCNYAAQLVFYTQQYENEGTLDTPTVSDDAEPASQEVESSVLYYTDDAVEVVAGEDGNGGVIYENTETGVDVYQSSGSTDENEEVTVTWTNTASYDGASWTDAFYHVKEIVDNGYAKQFELIQDGETTDIYTATNSALDKLLYEINGDWWFGSYLSNYASSYDGTVVGLSSSALIIQSQWSNWFYTDSSYSEVVFVVYTAMTYIPLASIGNTTISVHK
ncbi:MAG: hypothetical protein ACI31G_02335 [Bacilli bacterium]